MLGRICDRGKSTEVKKMKPRQKHKKYFAEFGAEEKAQVSFEYLVTAMFGIILAIAAAIIIDAVRSIAITSQTKLLKIREETISSLV